MNTLITTQATQEGTGRPASRPATVIAHLIPLTVLPAGVWRIVLGFGVPMGFARAALERDDMPGWGTVSTIFLSVLTECLALLSLGLVRPWGEVVPRWVPVSGRPSYPAMGRRRPGRRRRRPAHGDVGLGRPWTRRRPDRALHRRPGLAGPPHRLLPAHGALGPVAARPHLPLPPSPSCCVISPTSTGSSCPGRGWRPSPTGSSAPRTRPRTSCRRRSCAGTLPTSIASRSPRRG